jgi:hypothetical protein
MRNLALHLYETDYLSLKQRKKASRGLTGWNPAEGCAVLREVKRELELPKRLKNK